MNENINYLKDVIRMLESDKRLLARNIKKLRNDVKLLKKEIEKKNDMIDYLEKSLMMKQMSIFDNEFN